VKHHAPSSIPLKRLNPSRSPQIFFFVKSPSLTVNNGTWCPFLCPTPSIFPPPYVQFFLPPIGTARALHPDRFFPIDPVWASRRRLELCFPEIPTLLGTLDLRPSTSLLGFAGRFVTFSSIPFLHYPFFLSLHTTSLTQACVRQRDARCVARQVVALREI